MQGESRCKCRCVLQHGLLGQTCCCSSLILKSIVIFIVKFLQRCAPLVFQTRFLQIKNHQSSESSEPPGRTGLSEHARGWNGGAPRPPRQWNPAAAERVRQKCSPSRRKAFVSRSGALRRRSTSSRSFTGTLVPASSPARSALFLDPACRPALHQNLKKDRALNLQFSCYRGDTPPTCGRLWRRVELSIRHRTWT